MSKYLVTGVAGFIGSNIAEALLKDDQDVIGVDNFITGTHENIDYLDSISSTNFLFLDEDLADEKNARQTRFCILDGGVDYVIHQAALGSVPRSVRDPLESAKNNIYSTLNLLEWSRQSRNNIKRFVYAASASYYGDTEPTKKTERMPSYPINPYGITKMVGEEYCRVYHSLFGLPTIRLRYFNVFGPRQNPDSHYAAVIPKFITSMLKGQRPTIFGDGRQTRDFTYVQNVVRANLSACQVGYQHCGQVFNVACGEATQLNEVFGLLADYIGFECEPIYESERLGDIKKNEANIERISRAFDYSPSISVRDGLRLTVDWYKERMQCQNYPS